MNRLPTVHSVALPVDVVLCPSGDDTWVARTPPPPGASAERGIRIGTYTADELAAAGVAVHRLRKTGETDNEYAARRIFESLGTASVCWEQVDCAGVFDSEQAARVGCELLADLGLPVPEGYAPPERDDPWSTPDRPEPVATQHVTVDPANGDVTITETAVHHDDPAVMFPGTEPQRERHWLDRLGSRLDVGDRARLWTTDATVGHEVTVIGPAPDNYPPQVVQVRRDDNGVEMLAIAHTDLTGVS